MHVATLSFAALASWLAPAPAPQSAPVASAVDDDAPPGLAEQAALDVDTIVHDTSKAYLQARARLVAHPQEASEAILDRLTAIPAPTSHERKRLLDVLAELRLPEHLPMYGRELRRAVQAAPTPQAELEAAALWSVLLVDHGEAARGELSGLVADRELSLPVRARLLDDLVAVTPGAQLPELIVLVGRGARALQQQLVRALKRRVDAAPAVRGGIVTAIDAAIDGADGDARRPALVVLRAALSSSDDEAFLQRLAAWARDGEVEFATRVAAVRGLSRHARASAAARDALATVAEAELSPRRRGRQDAEVLASLALAALPDDAARPLADRHRLRDDDAPRLATLGWTLQPLPASDAWLDVSQDNPWPQVRSAALARVQAPCSKRSLQQLAAWARPLASDGERDPAVARAVVQALGRCGPPALDPLQDLMRDGELDIEQRTEAARQLVKRGGAEGARAVARLLDDDPGRRFARRLAATLRYAQTATPEVTDALCRAAQDQTEVAHAAAQSLAALHDDPAAACEP